MTKHTWFKMQKYLAVALLTLILCGGKGVIVYAQDMDGFMMPPPAPTDAGQDDKEQFVKEIRRVENLNRKYTKEIEEIKAVLAEKDEDFQKRMKSLEDKLTQQLDNKDKQAIQDEQNKETAKELETMTSDMLSKGSDLDPEDQQFKQELSKAHYNMGNIYFERGEYQRAVVEYYQAVDLTPNDPDVHYNLAFVSGEYLADQETALKHYQWYLYLKPKADDINVVKERIMQAKLHVHAKIDAFIDKDSGNYNLTR